jgi:hypothetical protein
MRDFIERTFHCRIVAWAVATDDGELYEAVDAHGRLVRADSLHLLLCALREPPRPVRKGFLDRALMLAA